MSGIEGLHERWIFRRRVAVLAEAVGTALAPLVPGTLLDVGCGDGRITRDVADRLPGLRVEGIDVLVRPQSLIPVQRYDGCHLPCADASFDVVMAVDVLHHADDPGAILGEMARVARRWIVLKDHFRDGLLADRTLRFMDDVGNRRHGVRLPYHYLSKVEWAQLFSRLGLRAVSEDPLRRLYPWPLRLVFGRGLHFLAVLEKPQPGPITRS